MILRVPESVLWLLLTEWLKAEDVGHLDSAYCSTARKLYLALAYGGKIIHKMPKFRSRAGNLNAMRWSVLRKVHLDGVSMVAAPPVEEDLLFKYLDVAAPSIRWICFMDNRGHEIPISVLEAVIRRCANVELIEITSGVATVVSFMAMLPSLFPSTDRMNRIHLHVSIDDAYHTPVPVQVAHTSLRRLCTSFVVIPPATAEAIALNCHDLQTLRIFITGDMTEDGVRAILQGCPQLEETDIEYARGISDDLRLEIANLPFCRSIHFASWRTATMSASVAVTALAACPTLRSVCFDGCARWVDHSVVTALVGNCPQLEYVDFTGCRGVTSADVIAFAKAYPQLRSLKLGGCAAVSDGAILAIAAHCPRLSGLAFPADIRESTLIAVAEQCSRLEYLHIGTMDLADAGLLAVATHCRYLSTLAISQLETMPEVDTIQALMRSCRRLICFRLPGWCRIYEFFSALVKSRPHVVSYA
jgi:hypothetical protein